MATLTGFTRPADPVGPDLAPHIATVTGLTISSASVRGPSGGNDALVTGPTLSESNRTVIQIAINTYALNPDFGKLAEDIDLAAIRTKAQAVFNGTDTFTNAQIQKLVAGLVLRVTR